MERREDIENYLGITDNKDTNYKSNVIKEFLYFKKLYADKEVEMCLTEDIGTYIQVENKNIYESGKYITVYKK